MGVEVGGGDNKERISNKYIRFSTHEDIENVLFDILSH